MKKKVGVWMDTEKAVIISFNEMEHRAKILNSQPGERISKSPKIPDETRTIISSPIETKLRLPGDTKEFSRFGNQHYSTEIKNMHKLSNVKHQYFKNILEGIKDVDELVLFGPSLIKKEFEAQISKYPKIHAHLLSVESADAMTGNQMVRWVENYFMSARHAVHPV
ncbi:MAG: hypothetical protein Q8904_12925 [Bacteroidota bacterium]|nr:hypothetical protein [Bacteroidota bacterium]